MPSPDTSEAVVICTRNRPGELGQTLVSVGGVIAEPSDDAPPPAAEHLRRLFFLSHFEPGRVLPSGCTTSAQHYRPNLAPGLRGTEWLSGCSSSYRRDLLEEHRFDKALTGYSMLEDLDLSYRIHRRARLVVQPEARLTHRRSSRNRFDAERYGYALTVHRRWFVEKHFGDLVRVGRTGGASLAASSPSLRRRALTAAALRGLLRGVQTVLARAHPLLSS